MGKKRYAVTSLSSNWKHDYSHYANQNIETHTRGWNLGVKVRGFSSRRSHGDYFEVEITGGSHDLAAKLLVFAVFERDGEVMLDIAGEIVSLAEYMDRTV